MADAKVKYSSEKSAVVITLVGQIDTTVGRLAMTRGVAEAEKHGCRKILLDMTEASLVDSASDNYHLASRLADVGFKRDFHAALVYSRDHERHQFFETVARNRGYSVRIFSEMEVAFCWLSSKNGNGHAKPSGGENLPE